MTEKRNPTSGARRPRRAQKPAAPRKTKRVIVAEPATGSAAPSTNGKSEPAPEATPYLFDEPKGEPRVQASQRRTKPAAKSKSRRRPKIVVPEPEPTDFSPDEVPEDEELAPDDQPDPSLRRQFVQEVEGLIERLRSLSPGYTTSISPERLLEVLEEGADFLPSPLRRGVMGKLRNFFGDDLLDADTWKGMWYVLNSSLQYQADVLKRRMTGEYETDEWGLDREYLDAVLPFANFMYKTYWRVDTTGLENIPETGRALLVSNHSGQLPWDGAMVATGIMQDHPSRRLVRTLYATWFPTLPFVSDLLTKCGQVLATDDNGTRLLEQDELVAVYPEGYKGVGKLFKERYRLARFGRGGFVRMALRTGAPMIPVAVVGAEETYISLYKSNVMSKLTGFPYFPISPTFPWLGLIGFVPLPTKWYIDIGEPIPTDRYGPAAANNLRLVSQLTDQVRNVVQEMIFARLAKRRSIFTG